MTVTLIAALSACGPGGTPAAGSNKITVLRSTSALFELLYVAEQQGFFKQAGLDVTIKPGAQDTSQNAPSVLNGEAQFAMTDSSGFLKAAAQGMPVRITTGLLSSGANPNSVTEGLLVAKDSPIRSFADLQGKTVGLPALGGTVQFVCEYMVQKAGGDPKKVKFVVLPSASLNDAVKTGKTDASYTFSALYTGGVQSGLRPVGRGMNELPGMVLGVLFSSQSYLSTHSAEAKKFIDAISRAVDYASAHPEIIKEIDKKYTQLPPAYIDGLSPLQYSKTVDTGVMRTVIDKMIEFGLLAKAPKDADLYWDQAPTVAGTGR